MNQSHKHPEDGIGCAVVLLLVVVIFLALYTITRIQGIANFVGCEPQVFHERCIAYTPTPEVPR